MRTLSPSRFLICLLSAAAVTLLLAGLFNFLIDPFGMNYIFTQDGLNRHKPAIYNRVRLLKAYEVLRRRPDSIVLGTSRSHLGFSPSNPAWAAQSERRYNLAFDGALPREMYAYLRHAHAKGPLRQVILALDSYHPVAVPAEVRTDFREDVLLKGTDDPLSNLRRLAAGLSILTSIDTLSESIHTIQSQKILEYIWMAPDGQRLGDVFFHRPRETFTTKGPRAYFDETDERAVGFNLDHKIPANLKREKAVRTAHPLTNLDYIRMILEFCRQHRIQLIVLLTPTHAQQFEISKQTSGVDYFANAKRALVRLLAEYRSQHPDAMEVPLYDFSLYSDITTEPLPQKGSFAEMRYYWDSSHFKQTVGDRILFTIFGVKPPEDLPIPDDFGVRLGPDNVETVIERTRAASQAYEAKYPELIDQITRWATDYKTAHGIRD